MPIEEVDAGGGQKQLKPRKKKQKKGEKLEFDAGAVFDVKPAENVEEIELNEESATFKARHGQGGDRRG